MAEKDIKIIKYTLTLLLVKREQSGHALLKILLQRNFERQLSVGCIDKFNHYYHYYHYYPQIIVRFAGYLIQDRDNEGIG
jgi:hypothetical protein